MGSKISRFWTGAATSVLMLDSPGPVPPFLGTFGAPGMAAAYGDVPAFYAFAVILNRKKRQPPPASPLKEFPLPPRLFIGNPKSLLRLKITRLGKTSCPD
jgi:hypothetical protein